MSFFDFLRSNSPSKKEPVGNSAPSKRLFFERLEDRDLLTGAVRDLPGFDDNVLPIGDDLSVEVEIGFMINYFGQMYDKLWINTNGTVTFGAPYSESTPTWLDEVPVPMIAPFWSDIDTSYGGTITYGYDRMLNGAGVGFETNVFAVTWSNVTFTDAQGAPTNTFQLLIHEHYDWDTGPVPGTVILPGDFEMEFNYDQIQWDYWDVGVSTDDRNVIPNDSTLGVARMGFTNGIVGAGNQSEELVGSGIGGPTIASWIDDANELTGLTNNSYWYGLDDGRYWFVVRNGTMLDGDGEIDQGFGERNDPFSIDTYRYKADLIGPVFVKPYSYFDPTTSLMDWRYKSDYINPELLDKIIRKFSRNLDTLEGLQKTRWGLRTEIANPHVRDVYIDNYGLSVFPGHIPIKFLGANSYECRQYPSIFVDQSLIEAINKRDDSFDINRVFEPLPLIWIYDPIVAFTLGGADELDHVGVGTFGTDSDKHPIVLFSHTGGVFEVLENGIRGAGSTFAGRATASQSTHSDSIAVRSIGTFPSVTNSSSTTINESNVDAFSSTLEFGTKTVTDARSHTRAAAGGDEILVAPETAPPIDVLPAESRGEPEADEAKEDGAGA